MVCEGRNLEFTARKHPKENHIRKAREINTANIANLNHPARKGALHGKLDRALEFVDQARTQTSTLILVKSHSLQVFAFSFGKEAVAHRSRALAFFATSSAGMEAACPESTSTMRRDDSSAQRRSNSASETSSKLNKSRCARDARSSRGSDNASASISLASILTFYRADGLGSNRRFARSFRGERYPDRRCRAPSRAVESEQSDPCRKQCARQRSP